MRLKGKTALISGAGRNIGKAIAVTFAREGADVILIAKARGDRLQQVAKECESLGAQALPLLADVSKYEDVRHAVQQGLERFGKVDILVNSVGLRPHHLPWEYDVDEWQQVFAVSLHSMFYFVKALAPAMIERGQGGSIIALGGMSALTTTHGDTAAPTSAKHGLYGLIKSLAQALGPHGIRANMLNPGTIESERLNPEWYPEGTPQNKSRTGQIPLQRLGSTQDIADAALFLASDESSYITGDRLNCMGGHYM